MASQWYDATVKAGVDAIAALLNSGGHIDIYSGSQPALNGAIGTRIARLTFSATAFAASTASGGTVTATANAITSDTSAVGGTAGYMALVKSDGTTVVATGTVSTTSGNLVLNSLTIGAGATVSCSSFTITQAQAGT